MEKQTAEEPPNITQGGIQNGSKIDGSRDLSAKSRKSQGETDFGPIAVLAVFLGAPLFNLSSILGSQNGAQIEPGSKLKAIKKPTLILK